jgi:hypothetical protein
MPGALDLPSFLSLDGVKIWLEQQVWGHRFYNDQTPWLMLLEAIGLMAFRATDSNGGNKVFEPDTGEHENFRYEMRRGSSLRYLLFADRNIDEIANSQSVAEAGMWARWFSSLGPQGEANFGYLRQRFATFGSFRNAVALLRDSETEPNRRRRLTSRHLAPRGPEMLFADFGEGRKKVDAVNKDRRFFARGGELLFLMLNRSASAAQIEPLLKARVLSEHSRWTLLAERLASPKPENPVTFDNIGYLPMAKHRTYEILGEDWLALLSLNSLPDDNLSEPLMRLSGLAVVRYMVERSAEVLGQGAPPMPIDMMAPNTAGLRKLSQDSYALHRDMSRKAIERVINDFVSSDEWKQACSRPGPNKAVGELVKSRFAFEPEEPEKGDVERMPDTLKEVARSVHDMHLGSVLGFYAEQIGLAASRQGASRWYAMSDGLLEALVMSNVREPLEFEVFLAKLDARYGFVIGSEVARQRYASVNDEHVKENQRHLENRLRMLGLLKRLSDDVAFVLNPFWKDEVSA